MTRFHKWVPDEIVKLYDQLQRKDRPEGLPREFFQSPDAQNAIDVLRYAMDSQDMRESWKAIGRRSQPATQFGLNIVLYCGELRWFDKAQSKEGLKQWQDQVKHLKNAATPFMFSRAHSSWRTIVRLLNEAEAEIREIEYNEEDLREYTPKIAAKNAKRTFLLLRLCEDLLHLYGQPLYDVAARTAAVILDEEAVDVNHVGKLARAYFERRP